MDDGPILLVEDNPDDVALTLRAFGQAHIANTIEVARDGSEALRYLFEERRRPAVVLLDLRLPRVDGLEVLRRIRQDETTRVLPVVVLTSSDEDKDIVEAYRLGANSYVRKPVSYEAFVAAASQLGLYWLVLNRSTRAAP